MFGLTHPVQNIIISTCGISHISRASVLLCWTAELWPCTIWVSAQMSPTTLDYVISDPCLLLYIHHGFTLFYFLHIISPCEINIYCFHLPIRIKLTCGSSALNTVPSILQALVNTC